MNTAIKLSLAASLLLAAHAQAMQPLKAKLDVQEQSLQGQPFVLSKDQNSVSALNAKMDGMENIKISQHTCAHFAPDFLRVGCN